MKVWVTHTFIHSHWESLSTQLVFSRPGSYACVCAKEKLTIEGFCCLEKEGCRSRQPVTQQKRHQREQFVKNISSVTLFIHTSEEIVGGFT